MARKRAKVGRCGKATYRSYAEAARIALYWSRKMGGAYRIYNDCHKCHDSKFHLTSSKKSWKNTETA